MMIRWTIIENICYYWKAPLFSILLSISSFTVTIFFLLKLIGAKKFRSKSEVDPPFLCSSANDKALFLYAYMGSVWVQLQFATYFAIGADLRAFLASGADLIVFLDWVKLFLEANLVSELNMWETDQLNRFVSLETSFLIILIILPSVLNPLKTILIKINKFLVMLWMENVIWQRRRIRRGRRRGVPVLIRNSKNIGLSWILIAAMACKSYKTSQKYKKFRKLA